MLALSLSLSIYSHKVQYTLAKLQLIVKVRLALRTSPAAQLTTHAVSGLVSSPFAEEYVTTLGPVGSDSGEEENWVKKSSETQPYAWRASGKAIVKGLEGLGPCGLIRRVCERARVGRWVS